MIVPIRPSDANWKGMMMNDTTQTADELTVLLAFAVEADNGSETLARYLESYPHFKTQLIDLAMDLELAVPDSPVTEDLEDPGLDAVWKQFSAMASVPSTELAADQVKQIDVSLVSIEMRSIGLPVSVLIAIKNGLLEIEGFPRRWMEKIAFTGGYTVDMLQSYIGRPPSVSSATSFKSNVKPRVVGKVTFQSLIESSTIPEAERAEILRED